MAPKMVPPFNEKQPQTDHFWTHFQYRLISKWVPKKGHFTEWLDKSSTNQKAGPIQNDPLFGQKWGPKLGPIYESYKSKVTQLRLHSAVKMEKHGFKNDPKMSPNMSPKMGSKPGFWALSKMGSKNDHFFGFKKNPKIRFFTD